MRFVILIIALLVSAEPPAQESDQSLGNDAIRSHQTGAELPDGVAFKIWLELLASMTEGENPVAGRYLERRMGLTEDRANALISELLSARNAG